MYIKLVILFLFSSISFSVGLYESVPGFKKGDTVRANSVPYQVFLRLKKLYWCAGTIIDESHVLTTASCLFIDYVNQLLPSDIKVIIGTNSSKHKRDFSDIYNVNSVDMYDDFVPRANTNRSHLGDISILTLQRPITFTDDVKPVKFPSRNYDVPVNTEVVTSTFGSIGIVDIDIIPTERLRIRQRIISNRNCKEIWNHLSLFTRDVTDERLCATPLPGYSSCNSDNGSALMLGDILLGLQVFSGKCGEGAPTVYIKINHYLNWIRSVQTSELIPELPNRLIH